MSAISIDEYRSLFRNHPGGVAVITVGGDQLAGFTATSVISVCAEPPRLLFSINKTASSWPAVSEASTAVVHFLSSKDRAIADRFATSGIDRFADLDYQLLESGEPLIAGIETWAQGSFAQKIDLDSSVLLVLDLERSAAAEDHQPLVYGARKYYELSEDHVLT